MSLSRALRTSAFLVPLILTAVAAKAAPAPAWQQLWSNHPVEARAAVRAALAASPNDGEALRAQGLLCVQEDDELGALQAFNRLYKVAPTHWSAAAYWPRMVELADSTGRWALLDTAARDILAAKNAAPELKASARLVLADAADRSGKGAEGDKLRAELGYIRQWKVIGPFDNVSLSGFDKQFAPEREIDFAKTYPAKDDLPVRWHSLSLVSRMGECAVGDSLGDADPGVFYAASGVLSPSDQAVVLEFDPTGASKVFVNGKLLLRDEVYRSSTQLVTGPFRVAAGLRKGWNTVLVKLADDKLNATFSLRFTRPTGATVTPLTVNPAQAAGAVPAADDPTVGASEPVVVSALRAELKRRPDDLEVQLALAYTLSFNADHSAAVDVLRKAADQAPEASTIRWSLSEALAADGQADEAREARTLALKQNPRLLLAQLAALADEEEAIPAEDRLTRLKSLLKVNPNSSALHWSLAMAYMETELVGECLKEARAAMARGRGPDEVRALISLYDNFSRAAEAEKAFAAGLAASPTSPVLLQLQIERLTSRGKPTAALAVYQKLLQVDRPRPHYRMAMARTYHGSRDLKGAIRTLRTVRAQRPQDASVCTELADVLREAGSKAEAISLYRTAVALDPSEVSLRDKLRVLSGEQPVLKLVPETALPPLVGKGAKPIEGAGASAVILLDEGIQVVYPDYATVTRFHSVVKILDAAAVRHYQSFPLSVMSNSAEPTVESARLLKPDGKIEKVDPGFEGSTISLPSLAIGDVIDVIYRVEDYQRGGLARQFWNQWGFNAANGPCRLSRYVLITPPEMTFQTKSHRGVPEPAITDLKGWRVREWRMENLPPQPDANLGNAPIDTAIWLDLSTIPSWKHVVRWYQDLSGPRCAPDAAIRARAAELTKDAKTEEEKIRAIVAYVSREIQYQTTPFRMSAFVPTAGKQVLRERYGDCKDKAALLTALLGSVGIKSEMVLLTGRSAGITAHLPSPRFNHAIARVHTAKGPLWVDATADLMEFGDLPIEDQQVPALIINDETTDLVLSPALPMERSHVQEVHTGSLTASGVLSGRVEMRAVGGWGWMLRSALRLVPEPSREQALRTIIDRMVPGARFSKGAMHSLDQPEKPMALEIDYGVERYGTTAGNLLLARLPWGAGLTMNVDQLLQARDLKQEIEIAQLRGHYASTVRLELPEGYTPKDLLPEVKREAEWGSFRITYRLEGRALYGTREVKMSAYRVPADGVAGYTDFLRSLDQETKKQFIFEKR